MILKELDDQLMIVLKHLRVEFNRRSILRGMAVEFVVSDFGLVVFGLSRSDYSIVNNYAEDHFKDWRVCYATTTSDLTEKRMEIIWNLMRGGYMKWLRYSFPRQVKNILNGPDNLGTLIIQERLRLWGDKPKHKFFIEDNQAVLRSGILRELTNDPSFFDFMPEEG